ncbi:TRAP transporter small permease subunit [Antarcticimicrobium luteum]|uniref:TRAP transporter small permease protein n=1 Tax=Antarcticimicrobium luteum TaxID=2547397 RepID=A0A4R5VIW3_9RHOB|nr:TRAP transporter small permease [Antarcticimicrobium luteum]
MIALIDRLATLAAKATLWLAALLLLLMAIHITADVAMRNLFGAPIAGTLEFGTYYYMVAASFLALGYAQLRDHNISVDILVYSAPADDMNGRLVRTDQDKTVLDRVVIGHQHHGSRLPLHVRARPSATSMSPASRPLTRTAAKVRP